MIKSSLLFLVIALIASAEFTRLSISVVPGWHTPIFPPLMIFGIVMLVWLYMIPVGYFILEKKNRLPAKKYIISHLMLTLFYFFPLSSYRFVGEFISIIIPVSLLLIGQLLFIIVFVMKLKSIK